MPASNDLWVATRDPTMITAVEASLLLIEHELLRMLKNQKQAPVKSPFDNTLWNSPKTYTNDYLTIRPYSWSDDSAETALPNFECADMRVSWYKYFPRGLYVEFQEGRESYELLAHVLSNSIESMRRDLHDGPGY